EPDALEDPSASDPRDHRRHHERERDQPDEVAEALVRAEVAVPAELRDGESGQEDLDHDRGHESPRHPGVDLPKHRVHDNPPVPLMRPATRRTASTARSPRIGRTSSFPTPARSNDHRNVPTVAG